MFFGLVQADGSSVLFTRLNSSFVLYTPSSLTSASFSGVALNEFGLNGSVVGGAAGGTETGTLTGKVVTTTGLLGGTTFTGTISGSAGDSVSFTGAASSSAWNTASSVATVAGTYTASYSLGSVSYSPTLTIDSSGNITGTDSGGTGCAYTGSVTTPDTSHNDYNLTLLAPCLPGSFKGIGAFFPAGLSNPNGLLSKAELKAGLTNGTSGIFLNLTQ